jgi:hypothetical protein
LAACGGTAATIRGSPRPKSRESKAEIAAGTHARFRIVACDCARNDIYAALEAGGTKAAYGCPAQISGYRLGPPKVK